MAAQGIFLIALIGFICCASKITEDKMMTLKTLLVLAFVSVTNVAMADSAFPFSIRGIDEVKHPMKFICAQNTGSLWYLKIDLSSGKIESYERGSKGPLKVLTYQAFEKVDGNFVYEFSDQADEKIETTTQLVYFNYDKRQASVAKVNVDPQAEIQKYEFFCSIDNRHLLIVE